MKDGRWKHMELDVTGARILWELPLELPVLGKLRISETMVVSWIVMILITGLCIWLTHDLKEENISKRRTTLLWEIWGKNSAISYLLLQHFLLPVSCRT